MAIASLYPTIKPSLLLDFANSKKLDPRITFTRATSAAYYDGVTTAKAEENLLRYSVGPLNPVWYTENGSVGTRGAELAVNGDFSSGTTGWAAATGVSFSVSGGEATVTTGTNFEGIQQTISGLTIGNFYILQGYVKAGTYTGTLAGGVSGIGWSNVVSNPASYTLVTLVFQATLTSHQIKFAQYNNTSTGQTYFVDDVTFQPLTADNATAPDGTATAVTATADAADATYRQPVTAIAAEYTFSVYLRRVTGTGNIDITAHSGGTWVTQTITSSWARYTVTQTLTAGSRTPAIRIVTSGDQIEVWGAQLEQRSAATAYTPTTTQPITNYVPQLLTAPAGVPRFDHNPTTGESLGLLIEEQRTNLLTYSEQFDDAAWTKSNVTITANSTIAPDGTASADTMTGAAGTLLKMVFAGSLTNSGTNTFSIYVKSSAQRYFQISRSGNVTDYANFDIQLPQATAYGTTTASIVDVGNGWYRCVVVFPALSNSSMFFAYADSLAFARQDVTTSTNSSFIWGAQLEPGDFPTSYIPTTSASVTRTADDVSMTGTNFSSWYNQSESTFYAEWSQSQTSLGAVLFVPTPNNNNSATGDMAVRLGGLAQTSSRAASNTLGTDQFSFSIAKSSSIPYKAAVAYQFNDAAFSGNGSAVSTDTSCVVPTGRELLIGRTTTGSTYALNGTIKKISYYPERLTNAQLQALTA